MSPGSLVAAVVGPRAASRLAPAALLVGAAAAFLCAWVVMHHGFYGREAIVDTPVYEEYGVLAVDGQLPYRDFRIEYPPAALPLFVLPVLGDGAAAGAAEGSPAAQARHDRFATRFDRLLAAIGAAGVVLAGLAALLLGVSRRRLVLALAAPALLPLALGSVVLTRYDLWPAALTTGALALVLWGRPRLGLAVLGVAVAAKVYPLVLAPLLVTWVWRTRGRRQGLGAAGAGVAALAACLVPFAVLGGDGLWWALTRQADRPLQVESLGAGLLLAADRLAGTGFHLVASYGSHNLVGGAADVASGLLTVVQVAAVVALWLAFLRGPATRERLVRLCAAAVCAYIAFGKVLSPQYLVWLLPLVPLVAGRRGLRATGLLALACVLTQLWFPYRYWDLVAPLANDGAAPDGLAVGLVVVRDLVLVALLWVLAGDELRAAGREAVRRLRLPRRTAPTGAR